ncbi:serine/threonine-protein kinase [Planctomicrobium piriforme]|uniref:Serine/threonine protein kinase n=1 Tax=Planctomicrobium piriforme TaxID=1576369 RepID=A0A1I3JCP7_9PLAN|nr:serine/threonine-protein kinase [Planctomicrobium piriforme]SFI57910.1 serine/threonine protein kinase [Planctomicrobium piriforme]
MSDLLDPLPDDDQALFDWLNAQAEGTDVENLPAELLDRCVRLAELKHCLQLLNSLAPAPPQPAESPSSFSGQLPRAFGPYDLERELGRGGMGVVYLARHRTLRSQVALKVIRTSEFASPEEVRRFYQEGRAASRLRHPHVVSVHDAGDIEGTPYLVMQYVEGESLAERMRRQRPGIDETVRLLIPIARAVDYLHGQEIVHRDLKPGNILLNRDHTPFVTDFGLVKMFELDGERTVSGALIGTPAYMSPEQAWGKPDSIGASSDVYSLGAILYEMLTGQPPFPEANPLDQILRLRDAEPRPPRAIKPTVPMELQQICLRCLEKKPRDRYASSAQVADDLERYRRGEPIALRPIGYWNGFRRWVRRESPLASHLAGFATMAFIVQIADLFAARQRAPYLPVMTVLLVWTILAVILQKLLLRGAEWVKLVWVAIDAVLFTVAVAYAEGPVESLIVGYSLLIAASSMWYEEYLVVLMTVVSLGAYIALLSLRGAPQPVHYPFIVGGILLVVGGVVTALVRRIRQLLQFQAES